MISLVRHLSLLILLAITACGGASLAPSPTPARTLDPATTRLWTTWALEAQTIARTTSQFYASGRMLPSQAADEQGRARMLAEEIRGREPSNELVLRLADDLDELVEALEFALEYAQNAGLPIIRIVIPSLEDALFQLDDDATELIQALETG